MKQTFNKKTIICILFFSMVSVSVFPVNNDTLLVSEIVPAIFSAEGYVEKEFFLVTQTDTSAFSCIVSYKNGIVQSFRIECENDLKRSNMQICNLEDSLLAAEKTSPKTYFPISFEYEMQVIENILSSVSKKNRIKEGANIIMDVVYFGDETIKIDSIYRSVEFCKDNDDDYLISIIKESGIFDRVNTFLKQYSLMIKKIDIEELYYTPRKEFLKINRVRNRKKVFSNVISGTLYFKIGEIAK